MSQENKLLQSLKRIFQTISLPYIIRHYIWGLFFLFVYRWLMSDSFNGVYEWVCLLCYPFSRFIFDEVVSFLGGGGGGDVSLLLLLQGFVLFKAIVVGFVFLFAPFIAPIGLLYLHLRVNVFKK